MAFVTLHIPKDFGGIAFSDPQQFSKLENFGPLGAGGVVHGEVSLPIDYVRLKVISFFCQKFAKVEHTICNCN